MTQRTYAITTASGRIGSRVARGLLQAGHRVRALGRDAKRLEALAALGATPLVGELRDNAYLERAFDGADAALLIVRGDRASRDFRRSFADMGARYADAARATKLPAALFLSSAGAHHDRHRGLVLVHRDVELALGEVPTLALTCLRAPFFLENLLYFVPAMKAKNAALVPLDPDVVIDVASTAEIASAALRLLLEPASRSNVHELHAGEPISMRRIAELLSRELGHPFPVERMPRAASVEALVSAGATWDFANLMNDAWDTFSRDGLLRAEGSAFSSTSAPVDDFLRAEIIPALGEKR